MDKQSLQVKINKLNRLILSDEVEIEERGGAKLLKYSSRVYITLKDIGYTPVDDDIFVFIDDEKYLNLDWFVVKLSDKYGVDLSIDDSVGIKIELDGSVLSDEGGDEEYYVVLEKEINDDYIKFVVLSECSCVSDAKRYKSEMDKEFPSCNHGIIKKIK